MWMTLSYNKLRIFLEETGQRGCIYPVQPSCSYGEEIQGTLKHIYEQKDKLWERLEDTLFQSTSYFDVQSWTRRCFLNNYKDCNYI